MDILLKKRILVVFGTRPEAIKLAPVILALSQSKKFEVLSCVTGQHREMLDQVLGTFGIKTDFDLNVMKSNQNLTDLTATLLTGLKEILTQTKPSWVLVQGDTTTTMAASLAAFYQKIPVAHVEAGLRTHERYSPFPEEVNRKLVSSIATLHFAPTEKARKNLLLENVPERDIIVTGNTVMDALQWVQKKTAHLDLPFKTHPSKKLVLITLHRRENFGDKMTEVCEAIRELSQRDDVEFALPVHLNPEVSAVVRKVLSGLPNVHLIEPQEYLPFIHLLSKCYFALTDSGGVQEEAPALGKPVLVLRKSTERPEAIESGNAILVGTSREKIVKNSVNWLENQSEYERYAKVNTPFGKSGASALILEALSS